ncbi:MAG: TonB-dependent receptor plug domain-containing protein [bacterium]|nr:TonB-dependent receptor plug domain-containing protein [bacterium]
MLILFLFIVFPVTRISAQSKEEVEEIWSYSLEELMSIKVTTASKSSEKLLEVPATMIVITKEDIEQRGYTELSQIFDDLPGMDVIRPYGDLYFMNYVRGMRATNSEYYIIMIDGVQFSHLYFNDTYQLISFPLSNIKQVEVLYGPASSIYGLNAMMGIINIITQKKIEKDGVSLDADFTYGINNYYNGDVNFFYMDKDFRLSLTGRFEQYDIGDFIDTNQYEYSKESYYHNNALWGVLSNKNGFGGDTYSVARNRALDLRVYYRSLEIAIQYFVTDTGYGMVYPADSGHNKARWIKPQLSIYARLESKLHKNIQSTTMIRYRECDSSNSTYIEGWHLTGPSDDILGTSVSNERILKYSYWPTQNRSYAISQDLSVTPLKQLSFVSGFRYEYKDLQQAFGSYHGFMKPADTTGNLDAFVGAPPSDSDYYNNRIYWTETGLFLQGKAVLADIHYIVAGVRWDRNSEYGNIISYRGGYIVRFLDDFVGKLLYGQSYREPNPRVLYGGWDADASSPNLKPEKAQTVDVSLQHTVSFLSNMINAYYVHMSDMIQSSKNIGSRHSAGFDYHLKAEFQPLFIERLSLWGYYSFIAYAKSDEKYNSATDSYDETDIGDIAKHKIFLGATVVVFKDFSFTLRGRYIGKRDTQYTNPVDTVAAYFLLDFNILYKNLCIEGLDLSCKIYNLFNTQYYHPGIRTADAGKTPGSWSGSTWNGSAGNYNSLLPQPGRRIFVSLGIKI